jgi:hypothetical protein
MRSNTNNSILRLFNNISGLQYNVNKCLTKDEDGEINHSECGVTG